MKGYFVEDTQFEFGGGWLSIENWGLFKSLKDIRKVIMSYDDFHDSCEEEESVCDMNACNLAKLPTYQLLDIWSFRVHRATPSQFERFNYAPSDIKSELI